MTRTMTRTPRRVRGDARAASPTPEPRYVPTRHDAMPHKALSRITPAIDPWDVPHITERIVVRTQSVYRTPSVPKLDP